MTLDVMKGDLDYTITALIIARAAQLSSRKPTQQREVDIVERLRTMAEVEIQFSEDKVRYSANRMRGRWYSIWVARMSSKPM